MGTARILNEARQLRDDNAALVRKLSEEKLAAEKARDAAEVSTRAKSVFIANISHEIRTPLNALLGMSQLLERAELERPHRDYVKVMLEAGRGLRTLLDDVIALAREDSEEHQTEDCDAGLAARAVAQLLQPRAWEKQLRLTISVPSDLPRAAADPRRVRQVLLKLAENALKFTERGGVEILVEAVERSGCVSRCAIRGTEFRRKSRHHLFEAFTPGDSSYTRQHQGAGLGLAVAKRVITQLGGTIGFESEPGEGSTFWFLLPACAGRTNPKPQFLDISGDMPAPSDLLLLVFLRNAQGIRRNREAAGALRQSRHDRARRGRCGTARQPRQRSTRSSPRRAMWNRLPPCRGAARRCWRCCLPATGRPPAATNRCTGPRGRANSMACCIRCAMARKSSVIARKDLKVRRRPSMQRRLRRWRNRSGSRRCSKSCIPM